MARGFPLTRFAFPAAAALLAGGCPGHVPARRFHTEIVYDCAQSIENADGRFTATRDSVGWSRRLGDGMSFSGSLRLIGDADIAGFSGTGFAGRRVVFFALFADRFGPLGEGNWLGGAPQGTASAFRVGRTAIAEWVPINMVDAIEWSQLEELLREPGDLEIVLYNATTGIIHQRAIIPRDVLLRIEPTLRPMHAAALERERDPERLCRRETIEVGGEDDIIIVD